MAKGPKFSNYVSPKGMAKMAFVHKPSAPFEGKGEPMYKCRILIEDNAANRAWVEGVVAKALEESKAADLKIKKQFHSPFIMPEDIDEDDFIPANGKDYPKYDEDHRDKIIFEAKSKFAPGVIDTQRQSLPEGVMVYGGDTIRMKIEAAGFVSGANTGITLRLKTVQLIEKNASFSANRGPDVDGFDDIDGYVAPEDGENEDF